MFQGYKVHFQMKVVEHNCKQCYVEMLLFQFCLLLHFKVSYLKR